MNKMTSGCSPVHGKVYMSHEIESAAFMEIGSAHVSDALRACGRAFQAVDAGIRPVARNMRLAGPAFTVRCYPGATWALEQALELAPPGSVLAVDGGASPDVILMGGLMSTRAHARGIAGAVLDAAVRDVDDIIEVGLPVFSRYVCPRAGTFDKIGEWETIICLGRVPVRPGDWIVADCNGVVIVPAEIRNQVLDHARRIVKKESALAPLLRDGMSLEEAAAATNGATTPAKASTASVKL
jgi:regulator of RNase E activity RraA